MARPESKAQRLIQLPKAHALVDERKIPPAYIYSMLRVPLGTDERINSVVLTATIPACPLTEATITNGASARRRREANMKEISLRSVVFFFWFGSATGHDKIIQKQC